MTSPPREPLTGTRFLDPKVLAAIGNLELLARTVVDGFLHGLHRSARLGLSMEFAQHRQYMPGDDIRKVDWRVLGRTDRQVAFALAQLQLAAELAGQLGRQARRVQVVAGIDAEVGAAGVAARGAGEAAVQRDRAVRGVEGQVPAGAGLAGSGHVHTRARLQGHVALAAGQHNHAAGLVDRLTIDGDGAARGIGARPAGRDDW